MTSTATSSAISSPGSAAGRSRSGSLERQAARIAELEQQVAHLCADAAELDSDIREAAKRVLPAEQVDGDRECVPTLQEVVELVVRQVAALRADAERFTEFVVYLADPVEWNWTNGIGSARDAADEVLYRMSQHGIIERRRHPSGGSVYRVNGRLCGRTDELEGWEHAT